MMSKQTDTCRSGRLVKPLTILGVAICVSLGIGGVS